MPGRAALALVCALASAALAGCTEGEGGPAAADLGPGLGVLRGVVVDGPPPPPADD